MAWVVSLYSFFRWDFFFSSVCVYGPWSIMWPVNISFSLFFFFLHLPLSPFAQMMCSVTVEIHSDKAWLTWRGMALRNHYFYLRLANVRDGPFRVTCFFFLFLLRLFALKSVWNAKRDLHAVPFFSRAVRVDNEQRGQLADTLSCHVANSLRMPHHHHHQNRNKSTVNINARFSFYSTSSERNTSKDMCVCVGFFFPRTPMNDECWVDSSK